MTDRITLRDRIEGWRQRGRALRAWLSFWRWPYGADALSIDRGSGDFLRDMGYADPDGMREKFALANSIALSVERLGAERAAAKAGVAIDQIDAIAEGRVQDVAIEDLGRIAAVLNP